MHAPALPKRTAPLPLPPPKQEMRNDRSTTRAGAYMGIAIWLAREGGLVPQQQRGEYFAGPWQSSA
eukprot:scaffold17651_cov118-Isochrysis_galbana.AAC.5